MLSLLVIGLLIVGCTEQLPAEEGFEESGALAGQASFYPVSSCEKTDDGNNFVKGTLTFTKGNNNYGPYADRCYKGKLIEYKCDQGRAGAQISRLPLVTCDDGCENGACVQEVVEENFCYYLDENGNQSVGYPGQGNLKNGVITEEGIFKPNCDVIEGDVVSIQYVCGTLPLSEETIIGGPGKDKISGDDKCAAGCFEETGVCCESVDTTKVCDGKNVVTMTSTDNCGEMIVDYHKNHPSVTCPVGCEDGNCVTEGNECEDEWISFNHGEGYTSFHCVNGHMGYSYGGMSGGLDAAEDPIEDFPCLDPDGGNFNIESVAIGYITEDKQKTGAQMDQCVEEKIVGPGVFKSSILLEFVCNENNVLVPTFVDCVCQSGACVEESGMSSAGNCVDSDGGKNYYEKGSVVGPVCVDCEVDPAESDTCILNDESVGSCSGLDCQIIEQYCDNDGVKHGVIMSCPAGCNEGVCLPYNQEEQCVDSGDDLSVIDTVYYKTINDQVIGIVDKCYKFGDIAEGYCNEQGLGKYQFQSCSEGYTCQNSVCVVE